MPEIRQKGPVIGLRGRLAASIAVILLVALSVTFVAVYRGTGADLRGRIDDDLEREVASLARSLDQGAPPPAPQLRKRAQRLIRARPFGPTARVLSISIPGAGIVTNQPELLGLRPGPAREGHEAEEREQARMLVSAPPGFFDVEVEGAGDVRLLTRLTPVGGGGVATIRVGEPLESVARGLDGLRRTFLIVGAITLLLGAAAGYLLAAHTAAPLRRMAGVAGDVDAGELSLRMETSGSDDEVRRLAESFNHMLGRLEDAFSRQRAFVSDASHELRTPLTVIRGQLEVLARERQPDHRDIERVSEQVSMAVGRMQRLVDDLLLLASTDEGVPMLTREVPLEPFLRTQLDGFEATADRSFELGPVPAVAVEMDENRIGQVVWNLLSNAVGHTAKGGSVRLSAEAAGDRISIWVDDDGPGIEPAQRDRVFDRFHREDPSRSRSEGGSGLGLAIAKALVEAHGGTVQVGTSPEGGARVQIWLPRSAPGRV